MTYYNLTHCAECDDTPATPTEDQYVCQACGAVRDTDGQASVHESLYHDNAQTMWQRRDIISSDKFR